MTLLRVFPNGYIFADPFNRLMQHGRSGDRRALLNGGYCIAEHLISRRGCTVEGYILDGDPHVYAVIDSMFNPIRSPARHRRVAPARA